MNAAKAHYENAAVQLSYAQIRSPISGIVADRPVYPGEMPRAGSPLVSIVDISQVVARANVPVKEAVPIKVGRPARITGPEGDLAGKVTVVSPAVDPNTTTVEVWVQAAESGREAEARRDACTSRSSPRPFRTRWWFRRRRCSTPTRAGRR